jgi:hypothetical protein
LPPGIRVPTSTDMTMLPSDDWQNNPVITTMMEFENMDACYTAGSLADVQAFVQVAGGRFATWPTSDNAETRLDHEYASTHNIQDYYSQHNSVPRIKLSFNPIERAQALLRDKVAPRRAVIVHVKSDSKNSDERETSINEWAEFIRAQSSDLKTAFIAIGNDDVEMIRDLPNVIVARDSGNDLPRDLALIQIGAAFMGLASGPAQMAILGDRPYAVFKPMNIHPEFMIREIGDQPGFSFATADQHLFRTDPTRENLKDALDTILSTSIDAQSLL